MSNTSRTRADERDGLLDEIERLETASAGVSKPRLPEVKLEETEYTPKSDAELENAARTELEEYKRTGENAVRDKSAAQEQTLRDRRDGYEKNRDAELAALEQKYDAAVKSVNNDAIKRGLARSSVATAALGNVESEYLKRNADIASGYGKKISELDAEISAVDGKLRTALDDFNLSYAARLNTRLNELKAEREQKIDSVTKYNNDVRERQAALDEKRLRAQNELYAQELRNKQTAESVDGLSSEQRDKIYKSVYDAMDRFLGGMDEHEARVEIRNHSFYREHLSDYYYARLFDKYGRNAEPD